MAPKDVHILNPGICEYVVTLHDKRGFTYGIMLKHRPSEMILDILGTTM